MASVSLYGGGQTGSGITVRQIDGEGGFDAADEVIQAAGVDIYVSRPTANDVAILWYHAGCDTVFQVLGTLEGGIPDEMPAEIAETLMAGCPDA